MSRKKRNSSGRPLREPFQKILDDYNEAVIEKCEERGCKVSLGELKKSEYIILKGEKIHQNCKMCDCVFFICREELILAVVELKNRDVDATDIVEKHQNTLDSAYKIIKKYWGEKTEFRYFPILLSRGIRSAEVKRFMKKAVNWLGEKHLIIKHDCGKSLIEIVVT